MKKLTTSIIAAALLIIAAPAGASAEAEPYEDVGPFHIFKVDSEKYCMMLSVAERTQGNFAFAIRFYPFGDHLTLLATDPEGANFNVGSILKATVLFGNSAAVSFDDGWGETSFEVDKMEGSRPATRTYKGNFTGEQFLNDLAKNDLFGLQIGASPGRYIYAWPLKGSKPAVDKLRECAYGLTP